MVPRGNAGPGVGAGKSEGGETPCPSGRRAPAGGNGPVRESPSATGRGAFQRKGRQATSGAMGQVPSRTRGPNQLYRDEASAHPAGRVPDGLTQGTDRAGVPGSQRQFFLRGPSCWRRTAAPGTDHDAVLAGRDACDAGGVPARDGQQSEQVPRGPEKAGGASLVGRRGGVLPETVGVARGKSGQATVWVADGGTVGTGLPCGKCRALVLQLDPARPRWERESVAERLCLVQGQRRRSDAPCGAKLPNVWGLYDMYGNVWEWCQDWYDKDYYANSPVDDPPGPPAGSKRAERGGSGGRSGKGTAAPHTATRCRPGPTWTSWAFASPW